MTASEWDDTPWGGTVVTGTNVIRNIPAKAAEGWQPIYTPNNIPWSAATASPLRRMREEQAAYWVNPWILAAENAVTRRVRGLPWHLEDGDQDTVDDETRNPAFKAIRGLLEKPQANLRPEERQVGLESWTNMISLTSRHLGLCGMTHWFLDGLNNYGEGDPSAILYVNPARLWPNTTTSGHLVDWILDPADDQGRAGPNSTRLRRNQILTFYLTPPDGGVFVSGLVQAVRVKASVARSADAHILRVFEGGGRRGGLISPQQGTLDAEQYQTLTNEMRSIQERPDADTRIAVIRGPIDFNAATMNMEELDVTGIAEMVRDDIFTTWGIPGSQAPTNVSVGLNGGNTKDKDEAVLMQGAVHDRVVPISQTIQYGLLDRYPIQPQLVIEEPEFDDDTPSYELASKAKDQPLTRNERRAILKLDRLPDYGPDGEPLGLAIDLPIGLTTVGQGEEGPKVVEGRFTRVKEEPPEVKVLPPIMPPALPANVPEPAKAGGLDRSAVARRFEPTIRKAVAAFLESQRSEIAAKVRDKGEHLSRKPTDSRAWWDAKYDAKLLDALRKGVAGISALVAGSVEAKMGKAPAKADTFTETIVEAILRSVASRVAGINRTTRDVIADLIGQGFSDGLSPREIGDLIQQSTSFDASRAEMIARTETALAYNEAALTSYREYDVQRVEAIDGDEDEECAERNGQIYDIDEAMGITDHPNGTLDWSPVFGAA